MSTEPDYNFNEPASSAAGPSLQLPFALLACTVAVFMFAQTIGIFCNRGNLRDNKDQLIQGKAELAKLYTSREPQVKQAQEIQKKLNDLVLDLLKLAEDDKDAKAIVTKYNIVNNPGAGAGAPPPAAP